MNPDLVTPYGEFPDQKILRLLGLVRRVPKNWLGQQIAQICRKIILRKANLPVDIEIEGIRFRAFLYDNISERKFIFTPWRFDQKERGLLAEYLSPDGVFVDIGANVGIYSLWAAKHLGGNGTVVSFEPNPPAYERLEFNIRANAELAEAGWPRVIALPKAVSDAAGQFSLYLDPKNLGGSSLVMHESDERKVTVECVTLLDQMQELGIDTVDALKIDIEGAEERALAPFFQKAPKSMFPRLLIIEKIHQDLHVSSLGALIADSGYKVLLETKMNTVYVFSDN